MRKIFIDFTECGKRVTATLLDDYDPENAQAFWEFLETPQKVIAHPTISTGDLASCFPRPPHEPPAKVGDQSTPMSDKSPYLCTGEGPMNVQKGNLIFNGYFFTIVYGDSLTEPLVSGGAKVAQVEKEYLNDFEAAGKDLWYHTVFYHTLGTFVIGREEN